MIIITITAASSECEPFFYFLQIPVIGFLNQQRI
jgi:hypothetical protein